MTTMKQAGVKSDNTGIIHFTCELEPSQIILFYDHTMLKWSQARIMWLTPYQVQLMGLEGELEGYVWVEDRISITDPDKYLQYLGNDE